MKEEGESMSDALNRLFYLERGIIEKIILDPILLKRFNPPSNQNTNLIKIMLYNNGEYNIPHQVHKYLIGSLIKFYFGSLNTSELINHIHSLNGNLIKDGEFDIDLNNLLKEFPKSKIPVLLDLLHVKFLNTEFIYENGKINLKKSKIALKEKGAVYTERKIVRDITQKAIENKLKSGMMLSELRILDFGSGTGRFYESALNYLTESKGLSRRESIKLVYAIDLDQIAIDIFKIKALSFLDSNSLNDLTIINQNVICKNMLITSEFELNTNKYVNYKEDFKSVFDNPGGFNVIISNPPYFLLKVNKKESNLGKDYDNQLIKKLEKELAYFRKSANYNLSVEGMLNYYRLSIEMMLNICSRDAELGIICPSSLFADTSSKRLRKHLLQENKIREINYFPESSRLFENVSQATVIFYLQKGKQTDEIKIITNSSDFTISFDLIKKSFGSNYEIPFIDRQGWNILEKLSKFKKIKEMSSIRNRRGELDLTLHKQFISKNNTGYRLIRGNMISTEGIIDKNKEFVDIDRFIASKSNEFVKNDFNKKRLICQQICNLDCKKRLNFILSEEKDILGNSCNYIISENESHLKKLSKILNSFLLDWRFKITSSNNHINNYELEELPLIDLDLFPDKLPEENIELNKKICELYNLNTEEKEYILSNYIKGESHNENT